MITELLPSRYAPHFERRRAEQQQFEARTNTSNEFDYAYFFGEYDHSVTRYLRATIKELITVKKSGPIVVIDIGGGLGDCWYQLACEFEDQVTSSMLAFVVSNLKQTPQDYIDQKKLDPAERSRRIQNGIDGGYGADYFVQDDTKLLRIEEDLPRRQSLVHFINGPLDDLPNLSIELPSGDHILLQNEVDIIHESFSVTAWGLTPETTLLTIENLASVHARYMVPKYDTRVLQGDLQEEDDHIREGIAIAHDDLQHNFGFILEEPQNLLTRDIRDSSYMILRRL